MKKCPTCGHMKHEVKRDEKMARVTTHKGKAKVKRVMDEFKKGALHSGSDHGPKVVKPKQAIAIALSEGRKAQKYKRNK